MGLVNKVEHAANAALDAMDAVDDFREGVRQRRQESRAAKKAKREMPAQACITDAFHRKLFNYADFDYLIDYLRKSGIASCENIYTLKSLSKYVANATYSALKSRSPVAAKNLFAVTLKMCMRRRSGLLAYVNLNGGKAKKLVKWETFVEYAGFKDPSVASQIMLSPLELFPALRSGTRKAKLVRGLRDEAGGSQASSQQVAHSDEGLSTDNQQIGITPPDEGLLVRNTNASTGMFDGGNVNTDKLLVAMYNQAVQMSDDLKFTAFNAFDVTLFLAGYLNEYCCEAVNIRGVETALNNMLKAVNAPDLHTLAKNSSKEFLYSFRRLWGLPEGDGSSNDVLVEILQRLLKAYYSGGLTVDTNFHEVYNIVVANLERYMSNALNSSVFLSEAEFPLIAEEDMLKHNTELLLKMYTTLAFNPADCDVDESCLSDAIMCMILYRKTRMSDITPEQYVTLAERLFSECGLNAQGFVYNLAGDDVLPAIKYFKHLVRRVNQPVSDVVRKMLVQMVKDILGVNVSGNLRKVFDATVTHLMSEQAAGMTNTSARDLFV